MAALSLAVIRSFESVLVRPVLSLPIPAHVRSPFRPPSRRGPPIFFPATRGAESLVIPASEEPLVAKIAFTHSSQSPCHRQIMNHSVEHPPKVPVGVRPSAPWMTPVKFPAILLRISRHRDESVGLEGGLEFFHQLYGRLVIAWVSFRMR